MDKRGGWGGLEYQGSPSKKFCLTVPKTFVEELLCAVFQKVPRAEKFMDQRRGGEYQVFPSKTFCFTVPKIFVGEPFCAAFQKISASEKVYG